MRQGRRRRNLDPRDVISGKTLPTVEELLDLIHEVNPTGRDLRHRDQQPLYEQKSKLQSVLVRKYSEDLTVEPGPGDGVVSIRLHNSNRDACHAVLASLDPDARSWLQFQLDTRESEKPEPTAPQPGMGKKRTGPAKTDGPISAADEALRAARNARRAYDYDVAREQFTSAFEMGAGTDAARELLEMLVEQALFDDVLALATELPASALKSPSVRLLLATAAAHKADAEGVDRWIEGLTEESAADVLLALARSSLALGDVSGAEKAMTIARRHDANHPDLRSMLDQIVRARAREREPQEAELRALLDAERHDDAVAKAHEILARWSDSIASGSRIALCCT